MLKERWKEIPPETEILRQGDREEERGRDRQTETEGGRKTGGGGRRQGQRQRQGQGEKAQVAAQLNIKANDLESSGK